MYFNIQYRRYQIIIVFALLIVLVGQISAMPIEVPKPVLSKRKDLGEIKKEVLNRPYAAEIL